MKKIQDRHLFIEIKKRFWPDDMNLLDVEGLDYLREKIFTLSFKILAFVATPMFFLLMIKMIMEKNYLSAAVDGLFIITYVLLLAIKSIPQKTKDIIMVLSVYAIGFVFIFQFNAEGSGLMVMLSTIVFTGFMMAKKTAIRLVLITLLVNLSLTLFVFAGHLETLTIALNKEIWLTNLLVLYAYGLGIFSLVSFLIAGLNKQAKQTREANKLVAASQKRYQAMIRNIEDVIMVVDSLGIAKYISPNVREIYGWQDEEVLNRPLLEKIYEDDRDKAIKIFRNVLNGTSKKSDWRYGMPVKMVILKTWRYA